MMPDGIALERRMKGRRRGKEHQSGEIGLAADIFIAASVSPAKTKKKTWLVVSIVLKDYYFF